MRRLLALAVLLSGGAGCVPRGPAPRRDAGSRKATPAPPIALPTPPIALPTPTAALPADAELPPFAPCPPPTRKFENAYTTLEAAHAVQVRLTEMARARCLGSFDTGEGILALEEVGPLHDLRVSHDRKLPGVFAVVGDAWVGLYRVEHTRAGPRARLLTLVWGMADPGPYVVKAAVFQVPNTNKPLLVVVNTHGGSSCWHYMRFAVFAPGPGPLFPRRVMTMMIKDGNICDPMDIAFNGSRLTVRYFSMPGWGDSGRRIQVLPLDYVARPTTLVFSVDKSLHFERHFGWVAGKDGIACLIEDWLYDDWKLAAEASASASLDELEDAHRRFGSRKPQDASQYSMELFPHHGGRRAVVYCDRGEKSKPCSEWPKPVDFMLELSGQRWHIAAVKER